MRVVGGASAEEVHGGTTENNRRELREGRRRMREEDQGVVRRVGVGEVVFGVRGEELQGVDGNHGRPIGVAEGVVFEHVGEDL